MGCHAAITKQSIHQTLLQKMVKQCFFFWFVNFSFVLVCHKNLMCGQLSICYSWISVGLWETKRERRRQATLLTNNFLTTLCHTQTQTERLFFFFYETGGRLCTLSVATLSFQSSRLQTKDWPLQDCCISRGLLHLSFHNAQTFPLNCFR